MMHLVSSSEVPIFKSPDSENIYCYSPGICKLNDMIFCTIDLGGDGVVKLGGEMSSRKNNTRFGKGKIFLSKDEGKKWECIHEYPFWHARPFVVDDVIYVIGHSGDLQIICSKDFGKTWSSPVYLTNGMKWHGAPCNVLLENGSIFLAFDRREILDIKGWNVCGMSPILLKISINSDLMDPNNWKFSNPFVFMEEIDSREINYLGIPFYETPEKAPVELAKNVVCSPIGWLEPNLVQIKDEESFLYEGENTFYFYMRAHTGGTNYGAILKAQEQPNGMIKSSFVKAPSGKEMLYVPLPGGHLKYHILYDEKSLLYWLISNQSTDSCKNIDCIPQNRFNLPNNERHRVQLHFSKNCIDWCFAGMVYSSTDELLSRNYPSMVIDGEDLLVVCRSADHEARDSQYTNLITFCRVNNFRSLIY